MRKIISYEGKRRLCDTDQATELERRAVGEFGDPAGYEEVLYRNRREVLFVYGIGGPESKYPEPTIRAATIEDDWNHC